MSTPSNRLIAVVDDDPPFVEMVCAVLMDAGFATMACSQGIDAPWLIKARQPAAVVLDLWMEHRNAGLDVLAALRADPLTHAIPVILCSAFRMEAEERLLALEDANCVILDKPFDITAFVKLIERCIAGSERVMG